MKISHLCWPVITLTFWTAMSLPWPCAAAPLAQQILIEEGVRHDVRQQVVDIMDVGSGFFAVGYINHQSGGVRYAYFRSSDASLQAGPFDAGPPGHWLRASGSKAMNWTNCSGSKGGKVGLFATQVGSQVYLDQHTRCNGAWRNFGFSFVDNGYRPSVATSGTYNNGRALVVYGQGSQLRGVFVTITPGQKTVGSSFLIQDLNGSGVFSTDVIYNTSSNKFIVGYVVRQNMVICQHRNVVVTDASPPVIGTPTQFGVCDTDAGGHHTSVAFNSLGNGNYAWWRQGMDAGKAIFIHDSSGGYTGTRYTGQSFMLSGGTAWTIPLSPTFDAGKLFMVGHASPIVGESAIFLCSIFADGTAHNFGQSDNDLYGLPGGADAVAIRSVGAETAIVTQPSGISQETSLFLNVSTQP